MRSAYLPREKPMIRIVMLAAAVLLMTACGSKGGGGSSTPPVDHTFDRLVGSWQATCTDAHGYYLTNAPVGTVAHFTVDASGLLTGWNDQGQSITVQLHKTG